MALYVVISPAKTMNERDEAPYPVAQPTFLAEAKEIIDALSSLSFEELKALWKTSDALTQENEERLRGLLPRLDFDIGAKVSAITSYEGIQYQHLQAGVMSEDELKWLHDHLRILSGVYGVLKPFDAILPYRLEMQAKTQGILGKNLYDFWAEKTITSILEESQQDEKTTIINCASLEYSKVLKKGISNLSKDDQQKIEWIDVHFYVPKQKEWSDPSEIDWVERSTEAKASRGAFVRWLAENNICSHKLMQHFSERDYIAKNCSETEINFYKRVV